MTKENLIPNTETVYELKNEYPSFEEFQKNYQGNESVINSYDNELKSNSELGGYGPCSYSGCPYSTSFCIEIFIEGNSRK
jgi:hypothetical protein